MTNRIKAASMTVYANDTQLDRVQTFGSTARLDSEDIREIGNIDIVEVVDNVPTVDVTLDANQYGSMKTLKKLANKNFDWGTMAVLPNGTSATITSGTYYISEMKYTKAAASDYNLTALYPAASGQHLVAAICINAAGTLTGVAGAAVALASDPTPPATPANYLRLADLSLKTEAATTANVALDAMHILNNHCLITTGTTGPDYLHLKEFEFAKVDFVCPVKEAGDNTTSDKITRTMYIEDAFVNRYDAAFSVNGLATESWSLESDNKTWFLNTGAIVYTQRAAGASSVSFHYSATLRDNNKYVLKAYKYNPSSGTYTALAEGTDYTATSAAISQISATSATASEVLVFRYLVDPASVSNPDDAVSGQPFFKRNPSDITAHPVLAGGLRQGQVEIYLTENGESDVLGTFPANATAATSATKGVLRVQSVSISSSLGREALYELGHKRAYDRPLQFPIPITVQVETIASDLREFSRLAGKNFATAKEMRIDQFLKNLDLVVKIYREDDVARSDAGWVMKQPLKVLLVKDISVTDEGTELRVEGNGTQTFSFKANTNLIIRGRV